jgi:hypothetical protein
VTQRAGVRLLLGQCISIELTFAYWTHGVGKTPWAPPLVELAGGMAGHRLAWEQYERDGSWWAQVSLVHKVVVGAITRWS